MQIRIKRILLISFIVVLILSSCVANDIQPNSRTESSDQVVAAVTLMPTLTSTPTMMPAPQLDISEWIVMVGGLGCTLEPYGNEFPDWYMTDCPEQPWFPIGQTTPIEIVLLDDETCTISPIEDFEIAIQDLSSDAMPVEFIQIEDGDWGCQVPYSDNAGIEVVCGFECGGEGIKVIIKGKTIREGEMGGGNGDGDNTSNGGNQSVPPPPPPPIPGP